MINAATLNIKTKPFMHTSWNQAISAAPLCTNRASVCLSVSVSHRTLDCYCWMVLYLFDFCGFHVVSCGMQEVWRYFKGHTRKCAGCIIRIKLFWGKVILTYGHRSGCDWSDLCMKWMSGFHCHWIGLMLKEKKNTTRNSITFIRWHKSEQSMEAEWWGFFYMISLTLIL